MIDHKKVLNCTTDLKSFFTSKKMRVSETREVLFRLIDYLDSTYSDDKRDAFFVDNFQNHKIYKPISFIESNKTKQNGLRAKFN